MAIPSVNKILSPFLLYLESGVPRSPQEVLDHICKEFSVTSVERNMRNASGTSTKIRNRVVWAKVTLKQAGLLHVRPEGGWEITALGSEKVRGGFRPNINNVKTLKIHAAEEEATDVDGTGDYDDGHVVDRAGLGAGVEDEGGDEVESKEDGEDGDEVEDQTPYERIDSAVNEMHESVLDDILERARHSDPHYFERIVVDLLERMGYGKGKAVGGSGDRGIDGILVKDRLGLDMVHVQAKRSSRTINSETMRAFVGALDLAKSKKGVFITTSDFSDEALAVAREASKQVATINGRRLAELMYEHDVGCETETTVVIKRVDDDYFRG